MKYAVNRSGLFLDYGLTGECAASRGYFPLADHPEVIQVGEKPASRRSDSDIGHRVSSPNNLVG
jgi:hypothetical protein